MKYALLLGFGTVVFLIAKFTADSFMSGLIAGVLFSTVCHAVLRRAH